MQEVFRFTAVRSARPLATDRWLQVDVSRPDATLDGSDDEGSGEEGGQGGAGAGEAPDVPELLDRLGQWLAEVGDRRGPRDVEAWVATSTRPARGGRAVRALVASAAYRAARAELATRLVDGADAEPAGGTDEPAVRLLLVCGLLERLATEPGSRRLTDASGIADWLARSLVVLDQAPDPPDDSGRPRDDARGAAEVARFAAPGRIPRPAVAPTDLAPEGWRPWMALARPPRVGELVVVERELCGYAMGEVADIENVLAGEQLEHQDRDLELTEEETVTEEERTVVRSDSRESREESRLRTEAEQVVQNDTRFEASLNLVAQYPPYVTLTADAGLQINTTRAQTDRSIAETAREVTEKAARQVTDRVLTRRTTRTRRERERRYRHRFEAGDTDVVGVYRFVDAVWTARSVRYDPPRLQCELVIPEPAAWLRRVLAGRPPVTIAMTEPTLPVNARGEPLGVTDIARDNWSVLAARVRATSVPPPPEPVIRVSRTIKLADNPPFTATNPANVGVVLRPRVEARDTLAVPDGYRAESYILAISGLPTFGVQAAARFNVVIGDQSPQTLVAADPTNQNVVRAEGFFGAITDIVAVSIEHELSYGFSGVVTVSCVPTEESMNRWRSTVHTRIWAAYQAAAELYESRLDEARARSGEPPAGLRSSDDAG